MVKVQEGTIEYHGDILTLTTELGHLVYDLAYDMLENTMDYEDIDHAVMAVLKLTTLKIEELKDAEFPKAE